MSSYRKAWVNRSIGIIKKKKNYKIRIHTGRDFSGPSTAAGGGELEPFLEIMMKLVRQRLKEICNKN